MRLVLLLALLASPTEEARELAAQAQEAIVAEDYEAALSAIDRAYAMDPDPLYLYGRAQAKRLLGRCAEAIDDYQAFLEADIPPAAADDARMNIRRCREAEAEREAPPAREPETAPEVSQPVAPKPEPLPQPEPVPQDDRPWYRDPVAPVLVGIGAAAVVAGAVMYGVAVSGLRNPERSMDEADYDAAIAPRQRLGYAGIGVGAAGALLVVGGGLRWGLVRRRDRTTVAVGLRP